MKLGFFTMPVHRLDRDYTEVLQEDREAIILADRLGYPKTRTLGTLFAFRTKQRLRRLFERSDMIRSSNFSQLLQISIYDDEGLSYRMPDDVKNSRSQPW